MFLAASIENSSLFNNLLRYSSVKWLSALLFSAGVVYATSQANNALNDVFGIDGSNFPYSRAILAAIFFIKLCAPLLLVLLLFALIHLALLWQAGKKDDLFDFPWHSLIFVVAAMICGLVYWSITDNAFGERQIRHKSYKLAHYLDFSGKAHCALGEKDTSYLFFGADQSKVLVDKKLELNESFEGFLKNSSLPGLDAIPDQFDIRSCAQPG